jgi:tripartite-type tricarboxylate transporter receptor subunit TctC
VQTRNPYRKNLHRAAKTFCIALGLAAAAQSQAADHYPSRPVTILIPFPAGTTPDLIGRILAQGLSVDLGAPFIVENRGGAGGNIGTSYAARSAPDGYTILMGSVSTFAVNKALYKTLPYDPVKDFAPITELSTTPNVVLVNNDVPVHSVKELIAYSLAHRGKLNFGSSGNGTSQHLSGELFKSMTGADLTHIPYKGGAAAMTDLRAGNVGVMFEALPTALPQVQAHAVRALAVTSTERNPLLPGIPTVAEAGVPGYEVATWHAVFVPAATPKAIVDTLNAAFVRVMGKSEYKTKIEALGFGLRPTTPEALRTFIARETVKWTKVVKSSGATLD